MKHKKKSVPLLSRRTQKKLIALLQQVGIGPSKWEYNFIQRLANQDQKKLLTPIEIRALDSVAHHYRDDLNELYTGKGDIHTCSRRCKSYDMPTTEKWTQIPLFPVERFRGRGTLMKPTPEPVLVTPTVE